jgi:hypothetical protein
MQIHVDVDDELLQAAIEASGMPDSAAVVERGLRMIIVLSRLDELCEILPPESEDPPCH